MSLSATLHGGHRPGDPALLHEALWIEASNGRLEAVLSRLPAATPEAGVLIANPHPRFGGNIENNVVSALATFLAGCGFPVLRCNYHGVGRSEARHVEPSARPTHWLQLGEAEARDAAASDLLAAETWLGEMVGRVHLVGYSLGAVLCLRLAAGGRCCSGTLVALPTDDAPLAALAQVTAPILAIQPERDFASRLDETRRRLLDLRGPVRLEVLAGADHFFRGRELEVAALAAEHLDALDRAARREQRGGGRWS